MLAFLASTSVFVLILIFISVGVIHFLPLIVAGARHVRNFWWIVLINVLFGWTVIAWIVALIWAATDEPKYRIGYVRPPAPPL